MTAIATENLMMLGHIRPGDLFWMTEVFSGSGWFLCISIDHVEDDRGISVSKGILLAPARCRLVDFMFRSAKEVAVPEAWEWKQWDVVPYAPAT